MRTLLILFPIAAVSLAACNSGSGDNSATADAERLGPPEGVICADCTVINPAAPHIVTLDAAQVVGGSAETGLGAGELKLTRATGAIQGTVSLSRTEATAVSLNRGYAGDAGPVLVYFDRVSDTEWSLPPSAALTSADVAAMDAGGLYVTAATTQSLDGAVRGQVDRSGAVHVFFHTLFGTQVVPMVASSGTATLAITQSAAVSEAGIVASTKDIVIHVNVHGLDDVSSVHVHEAYAGANGPVIVDLIQDSANPAHWFTSSALFDAAAASAFRTGYCTDGSCDPVLYVDIHTEAHPDGEVRAQLAHRTTVQFVSLSGGDVVPANPADQVGIVATTISDIVGWDWTLELTMNAHLGRFDDSAVVTLNYAPVGQNGPVMYSLERAAGQGHHWSGRTLLVEPPSAGGHGWYFNVATAASPDGELRGQWLTQYSRWPVVAEGSGTEPEVRSVTPSDGSTVASWPSLIEVAFTRDILAGSVTPDAIELLASGGDGSFGDGNELTVQPVSIGTDGSTITAEVGNDAFGNDVYQFSVDGVADSETGVPLSTAFFSTFAVDDSHATPSFDRLQHDIFTPSCAQGGCHSGARPAFGLDLSAGAAYDSIVNVPSVQSPGLDLVEPGDQEASYIVGKIFQPWWDPHPAGQPRLGNGLMQQLRQWIDEGAQRN
jgi:hypothetical protein